MGAIDLPAPLLSALDSAIGAILPPIARLLVWAGLAALLSMELYRILSPQAKIARLRADLYGAQKQVSAYEGEFSDAWPLLRRMLSLAFRRVLVVLPATIAASLPILALVVWLDGAYGHTFPPAGQPPAIDVPAPYNGQWRQDTQGSQPRALILDGNGRVVVDEAVQAAIPVLHKRRWWNVLIGNPAGYLKYDAPVDKIAIDLPRLEVVPAGPSWFRGWEVSFFAALVLFSVTFKWARQIE